MTTPQTEALLSALAAVEACKSFLNDQELVHVVEEITGRSRIPFYEAEAFAKGWRAAIKGIKQARAAPIASGGLGPHYHQAKYVEGTLVRECNLCGGDLFHKDHITETARATLNSGDAG